MSVFNRIVNPHSKPRNPKIDRVSPLGAVTNGAWPLSDAIGVQGNPTTGKIYDVSGNGFHGVSTGLTLTHTPFGFGVDFGAGDTENIKIQTSEGTFPERLIKSDDFTFMVLIKFGAVNQNQVILQHGNPSDELGWTFSIRTDGKLQYFSHSDQDFTIGSTALLTDVWYRIGISIGSGDERKGAIYVDGTEDVFTTSVGDSGVDQSTNPFIIVGKQTASISDGLFNAVIADITSYNRFISEPEAQFEASHLFENIYEMAPFATDIGVVISGGSVVGGTALISDEIIKHPSGGTLAGGDTSEEPPISGGVLLGGHALEESFFDVIGGILVGGIALEAKEFDSSGGTKIGGLSTVTAIYTPKFPASPTSEEFTAGVGTNLGPYNDWVSPNLVTLGQDSFAFANLEDSPTARSSLLIATDFNLNIPTGIIPLGIEVFINCKTDNFGRGVFNRIFVTKDGSNPIGDEKSDNVEIGTTQHDEMYGGASDLWGTTWTAAELNDPNFGFAIEVLSDPGEGTVQANVYQMRVQITAVDINLATMATMDGGVLSPLTFNETVSGGVLAGGEGLHSEGEVREVSGGILVGGTVTEFIAFDPAAIASGLLAGGDAIKGIGNVGLGGALLGGHAFTVYDEFGEGGVLLGGRVEITFHVVKGGAFVGGAAAVSITPPVSGGVILGGSSPTGFANFGGILVGGAGTELAIYNIIANDQRIQEIDLAVTPQIFSLDGINTAGNFARFIPDHSFQDGQLVTYSIPIPLDFNDIGLVDNNSYFVHVIDSKDISFHNSFADAISDTDRVAINSVSTPFDHLLTISNVNRIVTSGVAEVTSAETFTPTGGMLVGRSAIPTAEYNASVVGGALLGGKSPEEPPISGGIVLGGESLSFVDQQTRGGILIGGEGIEEISLLGKGGAVLGGVAIAQEIQEEPVAGGILVGSDSVVVEITPFHEGGMLAGGIALVTAEYTIADIATGGALIGGFGIAGIQPGISGGILLGGEAFEFITEIGEGGALIGGIGHQSYFEIAIGGAVLGGLSESHIDYHGHGGTLIGGVALISDEIIKLPSGGTLVGGNALRSTSIIEHPAGGALVNAFALLHYNFIGGVNFDDTVAHGGPITIGGSASVVRPTINFIGDGPVVISGEADASFAFSDYSFEGQTPVSTPVAIQGTASVILTIDDQSCFAPDKPCHISDRQTGQKRVHCTQPELFTSYCGDLRKGNRCSNDSALLPAIIACRQKLLVQQAVLDIKNKTILRNRGNVI